MTDMSLPVEQEVTIRVPARVAFELRYILPLLSEALVPAERESKGEQEWLETTLVRAVGDDPSSILGAVSPLIATRYDEHPAYETRRYIPAPPSQVGQGLSTEDREGLVDVARSLESWPGRRSAELADFLRNLAASPVNSEGDQRRCDLELAIEEATHHLRHGDTAKALSALPTQPTSGLLGKLEAEVEQRRRVETDCLREVKRRQDEGLERNLVAETRAGAAKFNADRMQAIIDSEGEWQ